MRFSSARAGLLGGMVAEGLPGCITLLCRRLNQLEYGALRNTVMADLLGHILKDPFFDQLRTKQQLGYLVFSGPRLDSTVSSLRFILQVRDTGV